MEKAVRVFEECWRESRRSWKEKGRGRDRWFVERESSRSWKKSGKKGDEGDVKVEVEVADGWFVEREW